MSQAELLEENEETRDLPPHTQCGFEMDWMWTVIPVILILGMAENRPVPEGPIHLLVAVKNIRQSNQRMANLARMFDSVLRHAVRRPLHWIFLIQRQDVPITEVLVRRIIASKAQVPIQVYHLIDMISVTTLE